MASIERRERGDRTTSYRVSWREAGAKRSETFDRERDAVRFRGMVDAAGQRYPVGWIPGQGLDGVASGLTVREWSTRAIAARTGITEGTRARYLALVEAHLLPDLGDLPLDAVNRERAALWLNRVAATPAASRTGDGPVKPISAKTVRNIHGLVSSLWSDAIDNELVPGNPFARLKLPDAGPERGEMTFLSREEFATVHDLAPQHYRLLLRTMVETGLRWGEVTALQVRHLTADGLVVMQAWKADTQGRLVLGPPKTKAGNRTVSIPDDLADALTVSAAGKRGDAWLFVSPHGHPLRNGTFHTRVWGPLMEAVEPIIGKRPRLHDLRHSHVAWLIADGIDVYRIMARMGHTSVATTQGTYGHLFERDDSDIKAAASARLPGSKAVPLRRKRRSLGV